MPSRPLSIDRASRSTLRVPDYDPHAIFRQLPTVARGPGDLRTISSVARPDHSQGIVSAVCIAAYTSYRASYPAGIWRGRRTTRVGGSISRVEPPHADSFSCWSPSSASTTLLRPSIGLRLGLPHPATHAIDVGPAGLNDISRLRRDLEGDRVRASISDSATLRIVSLCKLGPIAAVAKALARGDLSK